MPGVRDPLVPVVDAMWLEQQLAGLGKAGLFTKIILPRVSHFIPWEHPAEVERGIRQLETMVASQNPPGPASPLVRKQL